MQYRTKVFSISKRKNLTTVNRMVVSNAGNYIMLNTDNIYFKDICKMILANDYVQI